MRPNAIGFSEWQGFRVASPVEETKGPDMQLRGWRGEAYVFLWSDIIQNRTEATQFASHARYLSLFVMNLSCFGV
jgi:hypothetical protein